MTVSAGPNVILTKGGAGLPCASCLFDLGEASGMAGAGACPLKRALLRRRGEPAGVPACDAFAPGFCGSEPDGAYGTAASELRARLS
ncbi:MAG TPA: hypothetical protein VIU82_08325 [Bosea sp. (in: a-proteobacteria)]